MASQVKTNLTDPNNINSNTNDINNLENVNNNIYISSNLDFSKIKEYNNKSVDYIFDEKIDIS